MFNIKKRLLQLAAIACLTTTPMITKAEEPSGNTADTIEAVPERAILSVQIGYEFSDGSFDVWASGSGAMVSESDMVTTETLTDTTTSSLLYKKILEQKGDAYEKLGISLKDERETAKHIKIKVLDVNGKNVETSTKNFKQGVGVIGLVTKQQKYLSFTDTNSGLETNAAAKALFIEKGNVVALNGTVTSKSQTSEEYIFAGNTTLQTGTPIVNNKYSIIGIVSSSVDNNAYFIPNERIQDVLTENGVTYKTEGQTNTEKEKEDKARIDEKRRKEELESLDTKDLETAISTAEKVDIDEYTKDSANALKDAISNGKDMLDNPDRTQRTIDESTKAITDAQDALEKKGLLEKFPFIPYLLGAGVALAIIAALVNAKNAKRKKMEEEILKENEELGEEDFSQELGYDDDPHLINKNTGKRIDLDDMDITVQSAPRSLRATRESRSDLKYAEENDGATILDDGAEGTTLLVAKPINVDAYLIRLDTGEQINITKDKFIIGKERAKVDYCISDNSTISRNHIMFSIIDNELYIEDLNSKNFTYVNGRTIPDYSPVKLEDGMIIQLSNVKFKFHIGGKR